jgi:tetratricopeptide (TPR) repeat protein
MDWPWYGKTGAENDERLLSFDQNLFVSLLPFIWAGGATYFASLSRRFIRWEQLLDTLIIILLFAIHPSKFFSLYQRPIILVVAFSVFALFQLFVLVSANTAISNTSRRERVWSIGIVTIISLVAATFLLRPFEEKTIDKGGGLLKPNLMRFDFSQFLKLESEISLSDDLVLIVKKDANDPHILLRRFVLSGYDRKRGFFRNPESDEIAHPERIPDTAYDFPIAPLKESRTSEQEYYFVNFDPSAFIALNRPKRVVPFDTWDASSFNSAYSVTSETSEALPFELMNSIPGPSNPTTLHMSEADYRFYTDYGKDERIAALALQMAGGLQGYWDRTQAIYEQLKYGEYRYSLKPGIATDGDQLGKFLFDSKKGYCSYFAFSMALLVRSLGIPARVAVGFFVDPETGAFDYYPVRADMAHAWVEVYFPEYGWIEYDPTTDSLAEGEEFRFSSGVAPELFERLMREILENRDRLSGKKEPVVLGSARIIPQVTRAAVAFLRRVWPYLLVLIWATLAIISRAGLYIASRLSSQPRQSALLLARHAFNRIRFLGYRRPPDKTLGSFIADLDQELRLPATPILDTFTRARFAPSFGKEEQSALFASYRTFSSVYAQRASRLRRLLAWVLPPIAATLPPTRRARSRVGLFFLAVTVFAWVSTDSAEAQESAAPADVIHGEATEAVKSERWDRAVELYRKGAVSYPNDIRFPLELGDLYAGRAFYSLAWEQYKAAERLDSNDPALLYRLSTAAGRLNLDSISAEYLERVVALRPDDRDAIGDLGWMYFKLHRLRDGERFLLGAIERLGPDRGFSMTLGTIYSDLFEYELSKKQYLDAIADADANGAKTFSAVAHYNLSILEARHHRYAEAFKRTTLSIAEADRASGHLARGELFVKRLELTKAFGEYNRAYELDISPLSKINIADAYRIAGRLEEARSYAEETLSARDVSWMLNYGTNIDQHRRELHEILMSTYEGLAKIELATPRTGPVDQIIGLTRAGLSYVRAAVHRAFFRRYSYAVAKSYDAEGQRLDALINYYNALQAYPDRALIYLEEAKKFESQRIPEAEPSYALEEGRLLSDPKRIEDAIERLDPIWERDLLAEAWAEYARISARKGSIDAASDAAEKLFALNRGALRQQGIRLPLTVVVSVSGNSVNSAAIAKISDRLQETLQAAGFDPYRVGARFRLLISLEDDGAHCELIDGGRGVTIIRKKIPLGSLSRKDRAIFGVALADSIFKVE